jgi:AraC-like DNA-binding protein
MYQRLSLIDRKRTHRANWGCDLESAMPEYRIASLGAGDLDGEICMSNLGGMLTADIKSSPLSVEFRPPHREPAESKIKVVFQVEGVGEFAQNGRSAESTPGEFFLLDDAQPFQLSFSQGFHQQSIELPKSLFSEDLRKICALTAIPLDARTGPARFLKSFVHSMIAEPNLKDLAYGTRLRNHAIDLLLTAVLEHSPIDARCKGAKLARAKQYILDHLNDPELDVQRVAQALHMSERSLYNLFEREGLKVGRWIREQRLASCKRLLEDPSHSSTPIGAIALTQGFNDPSYFSTAFHTAYGVSPNQYRRSVLSS